MTEETKEISLLIRNLRLLKRLILGRKNPSLFLRVLSLFAIAWSLVVIFAFLGVLVLLYISPEVGVLDDLNALSDRFYISYIGLHFIAILGVILMWRAKLMGFYLFTAVNLLLPFWMSFFLPVFSFNFYWLIPSFTFILLFGLNWRTFNPKEIE